ncbi:MAG TPA: helix-turn-helix domain-containing protein [Conexibacter sp.]|nr:helix-turn-helix domain-containing protein [Conexibacter sp.]
MDAAIAELVTRAASAPADGEGGEDRTSERILDAALQEAAAVGLQRLTVEDVVRRAGVGRMTAYRRFPRRDDLVQALVLRETRRFLGAVAAGIDRAAEPREGVAEAFVAAVAFARTHPLLRRAAQTEPGGLIDTVAADDAALLEMGAAFIARHIHGDAAGAPSREARWVADAFARLFLTYVAIPPRDPSPRDDAELRRFAHELLTPMVERVALPPS